jgi:hypothetical protein
MVILRRVTINQIKGRGLLSRAGCSQSHTAPRHLPVAGSGRE